MRVLIAEDDDKIASFLTKGLKQAGFAVDRCADGEEGLYLAANHPYDAAVIERREDGKVKIVKKHETPTRVGGVLGGGAGLATGVVAPKYSRGPSEASSVSVRSTSARLRCCTATRPLTTTYSASLGSPSVMIAWPGS